MSHKVINIAPLNRVEGDVEIKVEVEEGRVKDAKARGVMFRGFERILKGRDPMDAIVLTSRICGICGASHGVASSLALRDAYHTNVPKNGWMVRNIALATEVVMSHLFHFYTLFSPDLTNKKYSSYPNYQELVNRFHPFKGTSYIKAIKARKNILELMGIIAGKWPNSLIFQPGGTTSVITLSSLTRAEGVLTEFCEFIEENLLGSKRERWLENKDLDDLKQWLKEGDNERSDMGIYIISGIELGLDKIGQGPERFLSYGAYELEDGTTWLKSGYSEITRFYSFNPTNIEEHIKYSYFKGYDKGRHPSEGITEPQVDKDKAYSWIKSPRYEGKVIEVGPLARMILDKDPLVLNLVKELGVNVYTRVFARLHETVRLLNQIWSWLKQIEPSKPFYTKEERLPTAEGIGLTEAPRGGLGHWMRVKDGKIENYQIITPTAWNLSPRDSTDTPGAVEQALIGLPIEDENNPIEIGHVVRSYDPCLSCAVHMIRANNKIKRYRI